MVETSLFPRPHFASFLQSDDAIDPLCYQNYQRLQRLQKVARLQERRAKSYEPGYKKADISQSVMEGCTSRQIFTKKSASSNTPGDDVLENSDVDESDRNKEIVIKRNEQLPGMYPRPTKSAIVHSSHHYHQYHQNDFRERPKTAVNTRDRATTTSSDDDGEYSRRNTDSLKETMAQTYRWTSATKRGYSEVDWRELSSTAPPPPPTTVEYLPDPVSQKMTFRRYHSTPEPWQVCGGEWDNIQSRSGDYQTHRTNFGSPTTDSQHIPGYMGYTANDRGGKIDHPLLSKLLVRRLTPQPTRISKRANVPGYTGHTHWSRILPAHCDLPLPNPLTSARTHREIPVEEDVSPFRRTSPLSKTITLVSPYNPFNKIEY